MHKFHISEKALEDLEEIWEYSKYQWSINQANIYLDEILATFNIITNNPHTNKEYTKLNRNYRSCKVKSHVVFYLILDTQIVEIVRVLHQSMDLENKF